MKITRVILQEIPRINILPVDLCWYDSKWVNTNDAQTNLSELYITDQWCYVPNHIYQDCLVDSEELDQELCDEDLPKVRSTEQSDEDTNDIQGYVRYPRTSFSKIQCARRRGYRGCLWYAEVAGIIPCAPSILLPIRSDNLDELREIISQHLEEYPFVRLCTMSTKMAMSGVDDIVNNLLSSERTNNLFDEPYCEDCQGKHLFMRHYRHYQWEARCFWSRDKLTAVSLGPDETDSQEVQELILKFFKSHGRKLPYHSAIVDVGLTDFGVELIEFNTCGPDMLATAGNFSWIEDCELLLSSPKTIFR